MKSGAIDIATKRTFTPTAVNDSGRKSADASTDQAAIYIDRVNAAIDTLVMAVGGSEQEAFLLLESMLEYTRFERLVKQYIAQNDTLKSAPKRENGQSLDATARQVIESTVVQLEEAIKKLVTNPEYLARIWNGVTTAVQDGGEKRSSEDVSERRELYELRERTARFRSEVQKVLLTIENLGVVTIRGRAIRAQVRELLALSPLPIEFSSDADMALFRERLEIYEKRFRELEPTIRFFMQTANAEKSSNPVVKLSAAPTKNDKANISPPRTDQLSGEQVAQKNEPKQKKNTVPKDQNELVDKIVVSNSENAGVVSIEKVEQARAGLENEQAHTHTSKPPEDAEEKVGPQTPRQASKNESSEVGTDEWYEIQRGDTLVDLFYGETLVGRLSIVGRVPAHFLGKLYADTISFLQSHPHHCRSINLTTEATFSEQAFWYGGERCNISHLERVITAVAIHNNWCNTLPGEDALLSSILAELNHRHAQKQRKFSPNSIKPERRFW